MATGTQERKAGRRAVGLATQALVMVSRSAARTEEFEEDVAAIRELGQELADALRRGGHPMKLGAPTASWWTRRNGSWAWQLTLPLPSHVTAREVHEAAEATRSDRAMRVQLQLLNPAEARSGRDRLPSTMREVRVGATPQHRGRELR
jgi:hypothetical protein